MIVKYREPWYWSQVQRHIFLVDWMRRFNLCCELSVIVIEFVVPQKPNIKLGPATQDQMATGIYCVGVLVSWCFLSRSPLSQEPMYCPLLQFWRLLIMTRRPFFDSSRQPEEMEQIELGTSEWPDLNLIFGDELHISRQSNPHNACHLRWHKWRW